MDDPEKPLKLVKDVANTLEQVAVNSTHTPALYSAFIRALINAKNEHNRDEATNGENSFDAQSTAYQEARQPDGYNGQQPNVLPTDNPLLSGFQFESEMGPVADMSTFPPTMAPTPSEDTIGSLTVDNILSSGFWDSVLVPGTRLDMPHIAQSHSVLTYRPFVRVQ
jgi:hypothetical protein